MKKIFFLAFVSMLFAFRTFDATYHFLAGGTFSQDWSNTGLITTSDNWSVVSSIQGFRGDGLAAATGVDPSTILAADDPGVIDVNANQTNPNTFTTGGVTEFAITDPVVALQGSTTARAPYLKIYLNTTGRGNINVQYNLRDIDGSSDNAIQPVALQYRVGSSGSFTNIPAGFVADATTGPSLATLVTAVNAILPAACDNQSMVELRIMTSDAAGSDEWVGIDDINISSSPASLGNVSVSAGTNAAEPGTAGSFTINFSTPTTASTDIDFAYTGSASFGTDYSVSYSTGSTSSVTSTGTLTVPSGTSSVTVTATPNDDALVEGTEGITLTLSSPTGGYVLGTAAAGIDLTDNDVPPSVSVAAGVNAAEPATNGSFSISFSAATTGSTDLGFAYTGTAGFGTDYTVSYSSGTVSGPGASGTLTVPSGVSSITVTITPVNDPDVEVPETIILTLSAPTGGYVLGTAAANITINSDDIPPPAPISLTGTPYTQDFNTLANTGTTNNILIPGWLINETGTSARVNGQHAADNGASNTADIYSYGTVATTERALGTLLSGTLNPTIGAFFINNTGSTVSRLKITYTGEQWRLGTINRTDQLNFQYSLNATSLSTGTWTNVDPLDFVSPFTSATGALNGNASANKSFRSFTITGLSIANGSIFYIRWADQDASGADDGLSVDDFTIETDPIDLAGPQITTYLPANGTLNVQTTFTARADFDENIQKGTGNIYVKRVSDNAVIQTINISSSDVTVSGNTASFDVTGLLFNTAYYINIDAGAFKDVLDNGFTGISNNSTWSFTTVPPPPPGVVGNLYNFNICTNPLNNGFTQYSAVGPQKWDCTSFGIDPSHAPTLSAPNGIQINGFSGTNIPNEDWLISPVFDLTATSYPLLSFWSRTAFNGRPLQLKVSTDYPGAGNPNLYTWTDLNGRFPGQTSNVWTLSENINLTAYKSTHTYFAFVYHSSEDDGARWTLDDILVTNSAVPPPPSLTVSTTDMQFPYVAAGASTDKTLTFTGNDLVNDVTLQATAPFELSKDGISFSSSVLYTVAESNNLQKTVYVRFTPPASNQDYTGNLHFATGSLQNDVNLKGTSIDPATTLEVVNWNLEWFGSPTLGPTNDNLQQQNVQTILQNINADIYGVVEIVDEARLAAVVSNMPGYSYVIGNFGSHVNPPDPTGGPLSAAQKLAFIYKTSLFSNVSARALINNTNVSSASYYNWSSGRYPFLMTADVTMNCVTKTMNFVLIHAKANTSPTNISYARRLAAANELHDTLDTYFSDKNVVVLGDFNDDLDQSITDGFTTTSYSAFMNDPANYQAPTLALSLAGRKSTVSYNDVIDHVVISNDLVPYYMPASANILSDVATLVNNYGSTTTDHYPVFTRYRFNNTVAPTVVSCTKTVSFCQSTSNTYTIPAFTASDDCDETITYTYTITGATSRSGNSGDASGTFNSGISVIDWTASDSWGNSVTCQTTVTVHTNPTVMIPDAFALPSGVLPNTVYLGYAPASSLTLQAVANGGTPGYSYSWTNGSTAMSTTVSPVNTTVYTVTVTDQNNCQDQESKTVTVIDNRGGKNLNKTILCHKPGTINNTIEVDPSSVASHLAHGDMLGSCGTESSSRMITAADAEELSMDKLSLRALPNPAATQFSLLLRGKLSGESMVLKVTDMFGRVIETKQRLRPGQAVMIGQHYQPGVYFAELIQGTEKVTIKLVKL